MYEQLLQRDNAPGGLRGSDPARSGEATTSLGGCHKTATNRLHCRAGPRAEQQCTQVVAQQLNLPCARNHGVCLLGTSGASLVRVHIHLLVVDGVQQGREHSPRRSQLIPTHWFQYEAFAHVP